MKEYKKENVPLAKKLRQDQTEWERKLWYCFLNKYPIRFQRQKAIGEYIVDFYCAKGRIVVELDGYYHTTDEQYTKDKSRTEFLKSERLQVLRFTNYEIEAEFEKVCKKIDGAVKKNIG